MIWKLNHLVGTNQVVGAGDSVPARAQFASKHARRPKLCATERFWSDPVALGRIWLLQTGLQPGSIHTRQISCKPASLLGRASLYLAHYRALLRLSSVTESIALPPRPKAIKMSTISKFSIRECLVPPVLLPIFFVLLIVAAIVIQW